MTSLRTQAICLEHGVRFELTNNWFAISPIRPLWHPCINIIMNKSNYGVEALLALALKAGPIKSRESYTCVKTFVPTFYSKPKPEFIKDGATGEIRTPDSFVRSEVL
jgi:hypothetical protein